MCLVTSYVFIFFYVYLILDYLWYSGKLRQAFYSYSKIEYLKMPFNVFLEAFKVVGVKKEKQKREEAEEKKERFEC